MTALIFHVPLWSAFVVALLVFGFAPGAVLRLIVLAFRRDDPRRHELLAELYAVPWIERPFWVTEQLEVALFEGLRGRIQARRTKQTSRSARQSITTRNVGVLAVTTAGVLAAVAEFDRLGRDKFLHSTGSGRALANYLEYKGRLYDLKAIVGYAHRISTGTPLRSADFTALSGAWRLEALGFRVQKVLNPGEAPDSQGSQPGARLGSRDHIS